ncbi:MAG: chromosomal replication initiator protein DnaA [Candidatus Omnitrophica bacterium]|nr:chromosomal replication initiator protein DnaA [Candidatus Omnitrophota bacterium]MDD5488721.1 chromosomal replication initiator protein DnaA [Candidatus Omnitrophota bacterium]
MENLWKKALESLRSEINEQVFSAWFLPISEVSCDDSSITLGVPNKFFENWIREKYISLIKAAVHQVSGKILSVNFKIVEAAVVPEPAAGPETKNPTTPDSHIKEASGGWLKTMFGQQKNFSETRLQEVGLNPHYSFDNFVVGGNNRFAHAASLAICEKLSKVYNPLFLYGGVGLGKTHLMQAIGQEVLKRHAKAHVQYLSSEEFTNQLIDAIRKKTTQKFRAMYRTVDVLLVDDIQFIAGKESTQEEFFHTFNALHDAHKQIVVCSDRSPQEIQDLEERLVSRFAWGLIADIQAPDFETRIAIIEKKSENAAIKVPKEVLYFLAEHIKTNIREMEGALIRVVAYAKLTGNEISVQLAKEVLKGMISSSDKKVTIDNIQRSVSEYFNIKETDMKTKKRTRAIAYPRQIAMYLSRNLTDYSLPDIGGFFGGRDHTTVLHACDKINKELDSNERTRSDINKLISILKH